MTLMKRVGLLQNNNPDRLADAPPDNQLGTEIPKIQYSRPRIAIEYLERVCGLFDRLAGEVQIIERSYVIAGQSFRLRFAGTTLLPFFAPALEHLQTNPTRSPALTINIWDGDTTGMNLPDPPWAKGDQISRGEIQGLNNERIRTSIFAEPGICSMLDLDIGIGIFHARSPLNIPLNFQGSPLLTILHWWLHQQGFLFLHAGAVGTSAGGVLLAGKGGSGKSTTALSCLDSNLYYVSDDYSIVATGPDVEVHSIYNSAKLEAHQIKNFPHLLPLVTNDDMPLSEKRMVYLHRHLPERILHRMPLRAIFLPKISGRKETSLRPASQAQTLQALAPSTLFQLAGAGVVEFKKMGEFVRRLPSYWLELGEDLKQIPHAIETYLAGPQR